MTMTPPALKRWQPVAPLARLAVALLIGALAFFSAGVRAQTCTASASTMAFGTIDVLSGQAADTTGVISVSCTWPRGATLPQARVCLNLGGAVPRYLSSGSHTLRYDLYQDAARQLPWGSIYAGTSPIALTLSRPTGNGSVSATVKVSVFGRIPGGQSAAPPSGKGTPAYRQSFTGNQASISYGFYGGSDLTGCANLATQQVGFALSATASVEANCLITSAPVQFPASGTLDRPIRAVGAVVAQCTNGNAYRISLSAGNSGKLGARAMTSAAGAHIGYQLYLDSAETQPWGTGASGTGVAAGTGSGLPQGFSVYGVVPPQATPNAGEYSDVVIATVNF